MKKILILMLAVCLMTALWAGAAADGNTFAVSNEVTALFEGETLQLELTRSGLAETGDVTWSSASPKVATVDENGLVTGVSRGNVRITAVCQAEGKRFTAVKTVQVQRRVTAITLNQKHLTLLEPEDSLLSGILQTPAEKPVLMLFRGTSTGLTFTVEPKDATDRQVVLTASDESILRIRGTNIQGLAAGECELTAASRLNPEISLSWHVLVAERATGVKIESPAGELAAGAQLQMTATVLPENATFRQVTWSSANEKLATVDGNGLVTGVARGAAGIRAQASDGSGRAANIRLNIIQLPEELNLNENVTTVAVGYRKALKATVLPANTNNRKVLWTSSDESICTVNKLGNLIPVKAGQCTVSCSAEAAPEVQATCAVTVTQPITKITFWEKKTSVRVGDELQLKWTVEPEDVTDPSLTFISNNQKVATVDENGVVHPVKRGVATITARANDGSRRTGSISVEVIQPVTGVHMEQESFRVGMDERTTPKVVLEPSDASNRNMTWTVGDTSIATVSGSSNKPSVRGVRWGTTTLHGVTEDGGFTVDCTVQVGNYNRALKITKVYVQDNQVKLSVKNLSNMNITRFQGEITVTDLQGGECPSTKDGLSTFRYRYNHLLAEGDNTRHGQFQFVNYLRPTTTIGSVRIVITGYETDTGFSWNIRNPKRWEFVWYDPQYGGTIE